MVLFIIVMIEGCGNEIPEDQLCLAVTLAFTEVSSCYFFS